MSIPQTFSQERSRWPWNHRVQVLFTTAIILLAGDSLLNLAQVTRGRGLGVVTICWEALKWIMTGALLSLVISTNKKGNAATLDSNRSAKIDRLYAELLPLMSRAASDPSLEAEVESKLSLLRKLQGEEAEEMEKLFESRLSLKTGEGWEALRRAEAVLARYEDPAPQNSPASQHH
jgi:hypothetical protein